MELWWGSGSPWVWRVMLALEIKGLPYESHLLQFSQREHKSPEFLALNPRGKVPTLRDGDVVVYESAAILHYLDRKHPEPPLFGRTPEEVALVIRQCSEIDSYLAPAADRVTRPLFFNRSAGKEDDIRDAMGTVHTELAGWEAGLADRPWLSGDSVRLSDVALFVTVQTLLRAAGKEAAQPLELGLAPLDARYPNLAAWTRRVEALPGYERTYPPHWRG